MRSRLRGSTRPAELRLGAAPEVGEGNATSEPESTQTGPPRDPRPSLSGRTFRASLWTLLEVGGTYVLRFGSNLILARLLFPEAFGLMALVTALVRGLEMLSDVGIGASIIQSQARKSREFLDTAWTLQAIRGVALALLALALTWPFASFYDEPRFLYLVPLAALRPLLRGLQSTSVFTLNRDLRMDRVTWIRLGAAFSGTAGMLALAYATGEVWSIPVGGLCGAVALVGISHGIGGRPRDRLAWDPASARQIYRFGRWIVLATLFAFVATSGDRLVLGRFLDLRELGLYSIASTLAVIMVELHNLIGRRVLFPVLVTMRHDHGCVRRRRIARLRLALLGLTLPPLWLLAIVGSQIVEVLYDPRYADAGWILQVLAVGSLIRVIPRFGPLELAHGQSRLHLMLRFTEAASLLGGMVIGAWLAGGKGMIVGVAASQAVHYPVVAWIARRYEAWLPHYDVLAFGVSAAVVGAGWALV